MKQKFLGNLEFLNKKSNKISKTYIMNLNNIFNKLFVKKETISEIENNIEENKEIETEEINKTEEISQNQFQPNYEKLIEYANNLNNLNCKYANRWLHCPYSAKSDNYIMKNEEKLRLNDRLYYHYYVNNSLYNKYIDKEQDLPNSSYKLKDEINQTLDFINNRIDKFEIEYSDYNIKIDLFDDDLKRLEKYFIKDLKVLFTNSSDVIIYNDNHCEFITYSLSTFDRPLLLVEYYLYALCFLSHFENLSKEYTVNFVYYTPTIESKYHYKTYISDTTTKTLSRNYSDIKKWYELNKEKIIKAALGIGEKEKGDWCKYCKHTCYLK